MDRRMPLFLLVLGMVLAGFGPAYAQSGPPPEDVRYGMSPAGPGEPFSPTMGAEMDLPTSGPVGMPPWGQPPQPADRTLIAPEAVVQTGETYTWTLDTRAEWEQGWLTNLDAATLSGTLRLMQRWFGESVSVTPEAQLAADQEYPALAVDGNGTLYAVWVDKRNGNTDIYFARSADGGTTWSSSTRVDDDLGTAYQRDPSLAVDGNGTLYVMWIDQRNGDADIYFARSTDGGMTWSANVRVDDDLGTTEQWGPSLVVGADGTLYAVWMDGRNGNLDIYFARSTDGGTTWSANVRVDDDPSAADQWFPALAVAGDGTLYAAWKDCRNESGWLCGDIYFAKSTDGGTTWSANVRVDDDSGMAYQGNPSLAVGADGTLYAAWSDERNGDSDIYFAKSADGGTTWSTNVRVDDDPGTAGQWGPSLAVGTDGTLYTTWIDGRIGPYQHDIYLARSTNGGATWGTNVRVNDDPGTVWFSPDLAVGADGRLYTVWTDQRNGNEDIYFARSTDGGATWEANVQVNEDGRVRQESPVLAADASGTLYALWEDFRNGDADLYFTRSIDGGRSWNTNVRVNDHSGMVYYYYGPPALAVGAGGTLYALWADFRNGNADIYFAKSTDGGATWSTNVRVDDDSGTTWQYNPALAVAGNGTLYAAWEDKRSGDSDIYFAKSTNGGATWSASVRVDDDPGTASQELPDLAAGADSNLYAVWEDERNGNGDIYFAKSADGGTTWSTNVRVDDDSGTAWQWGPSLTAGADGTLYALWGDGRIGLLYQADIYLARSTNGGTTWSANVRVNDVPGRASWGSPTLAVDAGEVYAIWADYREGAYIHYPYLYFARSTDGGQTWGANVRVDDNPGMTGQESPALAVGMDGTLYTAWTDWRYSSHIRVARSLPAPEYRTEGTFTSPILDTGVNGALWESLTYSATLPASTSLAFETRSRTAGGIWSAWEPASGLIPSPPGQYLQYRVTFSTSFTNTTPVLDWVKVVYHSAGTPSAPRFATPCGVTNQITPTLQGSAAAGSTIHLHVDGTEVLTTTADANGTFILAPGLSTGSHVLTATAENGEGIGPPSASLSLVVSPTLAYDPINVRVGPWSKDGWLMSTPRDGNGCADPTNGWRVWPRANQKFRVEVPVSYTTSAAVTVTVGTQTITLTEVTTGTFAGVFEPPIEGGAFVIEVSADGGTTTVIGGPVLIDPDGVVYEASGTISDTVPGVQVTLYYSDTHSGQWLVWDAWNYDQINPQTTLEDGYYSFYTPPGTYRVVAEKEGYATYTSPDLVVVDEPVRQNVPLITWRLYLPLVIRRR